MAITPYLYYEDVGTALKWLTRAFGLKLEGRPMRRPDGSIAHAVMRLGSDVVMMGNPGPEYKNPRRLGEATFSLYVMVPSVDALFARASKAGAEILEAPTNTEYGHRRCGMEDPEGQQWYFANPLTTARRRTVTRRSRSSR